MAERTDASIPRGGRLDCRAAAALSTYRSPVGMDNPAKTQFGESRLLVYGFLNCYKPVGMTSRDVVNVVQRRMRPAKVGHAGTLDPAAEGVLVLGVGPAVRLISYVQQQPKHYRGRFRLGYSSPSGDLEEALTAHPELPMPTRAHLEVAAESLVGEIDQTPPAHSAIHVRGRRAYERVRQGETVEMPSRRVVIHSLKVTSYDPPEFELEITCGSGTYIRTLGTDVAAAAGSTAVMTRLVRLGVGPFRSGDALALDRLENDPLRRLLRPALEGVAHLPPVTIDDDQSRRLGHGLQIEAQTDTTGQRVDGVEAAAVDAGGHLRAILRARGDSWRPTKVLPAPAGD